MRILIVSDVTSWMPGGVPAETRDLINGLAGRGHAIAFAGDAPLQGAEAARHFVVTIPITAEFGEQVRRAVEAFAPDVVHVICMSSRGVLAMLPALGTRRWLLTVHSVPPYERKFRRWHGHEGLHYAARALRFLPHALAWRWLLRGGKIPGVVVHSEFVAGIMARYGLPEARNHLVPLRAPAWLVAGPRAPPPTSCASSRSPAWRTRRASTTLSRRCRRCCDVSPGFATK